MASQSDSSRKSRDASAPEEPTVEDLARQVGALREDLATIAETLKALGLAKGKDAAYKARDTAEGARAAGEAQAEELRRRLDLIIGEAETLARQKPATAMGLAAGFGFLLGLFMMRR
ncbi:MAG: hypothetical protein ACXIU8_15100 [Alkalilacustris sp.]